MPKKSEKNKILSFLIQSAVKRIKFAEDLSDCEDEIDEIFDELNQDLLVVLACRRGIRSSVPRPIPINHRENILSSFVDDEQFRKNLLVDRLQFSQLVSIISGDEVFVKAQACKQFTIEFQLAVVLYRLGSLGECASVKKIAAIFGIGDGGTLDKITERVFKAFLRLLPKYICWPNVSERVKIAAESFTELPFCIGYVGCTEVKLAKAPAVNHEMYLSQNNIHSIKVQVVCDKKLRIRDVVAGHPGSWSDSEIFKNCNLFKHKERFFSEHEWIAGDSAYTLSDILITPHKPHFLDVNQSKQIKFNKFHSQHRAKVDQCFELLKERFCSLKELRMRINKDKSLRFCCQWIQVCCILHNILLNEQEIV